MNQEKLQKRIFFLLFSAVILLIVVSVVLVGVFYSKDPEGASRYSAVYLETGDVYFGQVRRFPRFHLRDAWLLESGADGQGQVQLRVVPFRTSFYGPTNQLFINPEQIVWRAPIRRNSDIISLFENSDLPAQENQNNQGSVISEEIPEGILEDDSGVIGE